MVDPLVAAAAVSAVPATLAAVLAYRAAMHGRENRATLERQTTALARVEKATNGELSRKIREALRDELIQSSSNTNEMRLLLDAILRGVQGIDEDDTA